MKFKVIFILFNIVILFSFLIIFFMPLIVLGWEYTRDFWSTNWYLPLIFILIMVLLNTYFIQNWKLFTLLEKEDWNEIRDFTSAKITTGKITKQYLRILINASLVTSKLDTIDDIQGLIWEKKPGWKEEFVLFFGLPHLLGNDAVKLEEYYRQFLEIKTKDRQWVLWSYSFALMLLKRYEEAKVQFLNIPKEGDDPIILALTGYMIQGFTESSDEEIIKLHNEIKTSLTAIYDQTKWSRTVEKAKEKVHVAVLTKLIEDATLWLFSKEETVNTGEGVVEGDNT